MLNNIYIKNFILIESLTLEFGNKLSVITGETGSGKSILLDAISFCMNGKAGTEILRNKDENCVISLSFLYNQKLELVLEDLGIDCAGNEDIIISRHISQENKRKITINNQPVTQKILDSLSENLVIIYGQYSFSYLFKVSSHIKILDNFVEDKRIYKEISDYYKKIKLISNEMDLLTKEQQRTSQEIDYLEHVADEITKAKIQQGEEEELSNLRLHLQQNSKRKQVIQDLAENLKEAEISSKISSIIRQINRSVSAENLQNILIQLENATNHIEEAENLLSSQMNNQYFIGNLDEVEERLFMIKALARKYQTPSDELLNYLKEVEEKLAKFEQSDTQIKALEKELAICKASYLKYAEILSNLRKEASLIVENLVSNELSALKMQGCHFKVEVGQSNKIELDEKGMDDVKFIASTNPGTPYSSIEKIASGGEMARFMLALQVALFQNNNSLPTIIFDEIDTGIGGSVADAVGSRLKKLADKTQVIVVTHQPQVASKSSHHIKITKDQASKSTRTIATVISKDERTNEIARMLSGEVITESAKKAALDLIKAE